MSKYPQDCTNCKHKKVDPNNPYRLLDPRCKDCNYIKVRDKWEKK